MRFLRLTDEQRHIKRWRAKRNHLVCEILEKDKTITRAEALKKANVIVGPMPGRSVHPQPVAKHRIMRNGNSSRPKCHGCKNSAKKGQQLCGRCKRERNLAACQPVASDKLLEAAKILNAKWDSDES